MNKITNKIKAFTLIELMIVVAIIAILAAIAVPNFLEAQTRSKVSKVHAEQRTIATALEAYAVEFNAYPVNQSLNDNVMKRTGGMVMGFLPTSLSTPVAFITEPPLDEFKARIMEDHRHTFVYINPGNTMDMERRRYLAAVRGLDPNNMMVTNGLNAPNWAIISCGPDTEHGVMHMNMNPNMTPPPFMLMFPMGRSQQFYDPTNGTVSDGDLIRFAQ